MDGLLNRSRTPIQLRLSSWFISGLLTIIAKALCRFDVTQESKVYTR